MPSGWTRSPARRLSERLVAVGISRLLRTWPEDTRARWAEEIEADYRSCARRPWAALGFALALRWTAGKRQLARLSPRRQLAGLGEMSAEDRERLTIVLSNLGGTTPQGRALIAYERRARWQREARLRKRREA